MNAATRTIADLKGQPIQVFTLRRGLMAKTSGTYTDASMFYCVANGSITFTYPDTSTETIAFSAGEVFAAPMECTNFIIVSGTFHIGG